MEKEAVDASEETLRRWIISVGPAVLQPSAAADHAAVCRNDPHRHSGAVGRQIRRLAGAGQRRGVWGLKGDPRHALRAETRATMADVLARLG